MRKKPEVKPIQPKPSGVQHPDPEPKKLMAKVEHVQYHWCRTCSTSTRPVVIVATELGHTTIICRACVKQLGGLWE